MFVHQVQPEILQSVDVDDVESALRSCLLKLQFANASLGPLKKGVHEAPSMLNKITEKELLHSIVLTLLACQSCVLAA
jgi:hypothetical protein